REARSERQERTDRQERTAARQDRSDDNRQEGRQDRQRGQNGQQQGGNHQGGNQQGGSQQNGQQSGQSQGGQQARQGNGMDDGDGTGRRRRNRNRNRNRDKRRVTGGQQQPENEALPQVNEDDVLVPVAGLLEVLDNYAFVRTSGYLPGPNDVYVPMSMVKRYGLRKGDAVTGQVRAPSEDGQSRDQVAVGSKNN